MKTKLLFVIAMLSSIGLCHGQSVTAELLSKTNSISVKKQRDIQLIIPIELNIVNQTSDTVNQTVILRLSHPSSPMLEMTRNDFAQITISNNSQLFKASPRKSTPLTNPFFIIIPDNVNFVSDVLLIAEVRINDVLVNSIQITISPADELLSVTNYLDTINKLNYVTEVKIDKNIITVYGFKNEVFTSRRMILEDNEVFAIWKSKWAGIERLSLFTIPFKVRPNVGSIESFAQSGITNLGLNIDIYQLKWDRYFSTGKKSSHRFSGGIWVAPSVEELDAIVTRGHLKTEKSKQLFISTALTLSYSYNDISFVFVPVGFDFSTSSVGKDWIYRGRRWWGFGIGVSTTFLSSLFDKK
jgi:hypothetical protein